MHLCPFCETPCASLELLAKHVLKKHDGQQLENVRLDLTSGSKEMMGVCWCGYEMCQPHQENWIAFAKHLQERGGLENHILEITLGLYRR